MRDGPKNQANYSLNDSCLQIGAMSWTKYVHQNKDKTIHFDSFENVHMLRSM